jgi:hypothetical protein
MIIRKAFALCALSFLLSSSGIVKAGTLTTTDDTVAADLANALTTGGAGGITITSESLSGNHFESIHNNKVENITSSGIFSTVGTNKFWSVGKRYCHQHRQRRSGWHNWTRHLRSHDRFRRLRNPERSLPTQSDRVGAIRLERRHGIRHHLYGRAEHQSCFLQHGLHFS